METIRLDEVQCHMWRKRDDQEVIIRGLIHRINSAFSDMNNHVSNVGTIHTAQHIFNSQINWINQLGDAFAKYQSLAELADYYIPSYK